MLMFMHLLSRAIGAKNINIIKYPQLNSSSMNNLSGLSYHILLRLVDYINTLTRLIDSSSAYIWSDEARLELKNIRKELERALDFLKKLVSTYPNIKVEDCQNKAASALEIISNIDKYETSDMAVNDITNVIHKFKDSLLNIEQELNSIESLPALHGVHSTSKCLQVRRLVNPHSSDIIVFYPGASDDIFIPLECTDAKLFVFVDIIEPGLNTGDVDAHINSIVSQIINLGGKVNVQKVDNDTFIFWFELEGRQRRLVYYFKKDVTIFTPPELLNGYDIYFSRGFYLPSPKSLANFIRLMKIGGFFVGEGGGDFDEYDIPDLGFKFIDNSGGFLVAAKSKQINNLLTRIISRVGLSELRRNTAFASRTIEKLEKDKQAGLQVQIPDKITISIRIMNEIFLLINPLYRLFFRKKVSDINHRFEKLRRFN